MAKAHEQRAAMLELRLDALEATLRIYDNCESKVESMAELIDIRLKEIYEANKRYDTMFRDVAHEMAVIKSSPNHSLAQEMENLRLHVDQIDQNFRNVHLVLTGLATEFQSIQGVTQFFQNHLKVNVTPMEIASVASIGLTKQGQTFTKVTFYSVDSRIKVYKARAIMKGTPNQIWLNEDLTKRKEYLDYVARVI